MLVSGAPGGGVPDAGVPALEDAGSSSTDTSVPAGAHSVDTLPRDLLGYWDLGSQEGDCIDTEDYLSFRAGGIADSIQVNDDACYPEDRGIFILPGTYALAGRTLSITTPRGLTRSAVAVSQRSGGPSLCRQVLVQVEPLHWQGVVESEAPRDETQLVRRRKQVDLFLDAPPPTAGEASGTAELRYEITSREEWLPPGDVILVSEPTVTADALSDLTWRSGPSPFDPGLQRIEVGGIPAAVVADTSVYVQLDEMLALSGTRFGLSLDPGQPDHLSGPCVVAVNGTPAALRR